METGCHQGNEKMGGNSFISFNDYYVFKRSGHFLMRDGVAREDRASALSLALAAACRTDSGVVVQTARLNRKE